MRNQIGDVGAWVRRVLGVLGVAAVVGLMVACDDGGGNNNSGAGDSITSVSGVQVYSTDGTPYKGSGTVTMAYGWDQHEDQPLYLPPFGEVNNGRLTFVLPASVPDEALSDLNAESWALHGITVSGADVKALAALEPEGSISFELFNSAHECVGYLVYTDYPARYPGFTFCEYMYFSKACSITGSGVGYDGSTMNYSVDAKSGWNTTLTILNYEPGDTMTITVTTDMSKAPSGMKWYVGSADEAEESTGIRRALGRVFGR